MSVITSAMIDTSATVPPIPSERFSESPLDSLVSYPCEERQHLAIDRACKQLLCLNNCCSRGQTIAGCYCVVNGSLNAQNVVWGLSIRSECAMPPESPYPMATLSAESEPWCNKNML